MPTRLAFVIPLGGHSVTTDRPCQRGQNTDVMLLFMSQEVALRRCADRVGQHQRYWDEMWSSKRAVAQLQLQRESHAFLDDSSAPIDGA